ncbi:Aste57867_13766 [Aphanomyces stellatus]|uniref:Aste57867_13766 protein n=1 Tax=Aphanomyces stellatus TaxID=120398 RepID=A0A485KZ89_9STRA|nr:hypothetical protein As57867_013716 [Aphanomyces stellatus]VFT90599.1 Aste57867_13766 [Aphanomyces stellatus]
MAKFCRECGTPLHGRRFCTQCGKEALPSTTEVPAYAPPPVPVAMPPPAPLPKKRAGSVEVPDAAVGADATSIYKRLIATVRGTHHGPNAESVVNDFKRDCKAYGVGTLSADAFIANLRVYVGDFMMDTTMPQLVRLIPDDAKRATLMHIFHDQSKNKATRTSMPSRAVSGGLATDLPRAASTGSSAAAPLPPPPSSSSSVSLEPMRSFSDGNPPSAQPPSAAKWPAMSLYRNDTLCEICSTPFDVVNRRHHCRKCGKSACQSCSPAHMLIPPGHAHETAKGYDPAVPQRVCTLCTPMLQPLQARLETIYAKCHKEQEPEPTKKSWFKSLPMKQTIEDECETAAAMLRQFFLTPAIDKQIPVALLERAHGLAFLTVVKAGLLVTAKMGSGIVVTKLPNDTWSAPSAIGTAGLGGGLEGGGELVQILLILGSAAAVSVFYQTQVTLGAGLDVAVGPYGRSAHAAVSKSGGGLGVNYSYSHSRGLFAGISLHGAVVNCRADANRAFYGRLVTPTEILTGAVAPPRAAHDLYQAIHDAIQSCSDFRDDQRTRQQRACTSPGCPCEKFRPKTMSAKCANCGHGH